MFIIYICINLLKTLKTIQHEQDCSYPVLGTNDVSRLSFRPLASYRQTNRQETTDDEKIFYLKVNILMFWTFLNRLVLKMTNLLFVWPYLVLHGDFCGESIVCVPFLVEVEAQVAHFVLSLQVASWLPCVCVVGARGGKLLPDKRGMEWWGGRWRWKMRWEGRQKGTLPR